MRYSRKGQTYLLFIFMMIFIILPVFILSIDIGRALLIKQKQQWATDAAAIAGATSVAQLTLDEILDAETLEAEVSWYAREYAQNNELPATAISTNITVSSSAVTPMVSVLITARTNYTHFLSQISKVPAAPIITKAQAVFDTTNMPWVRLTK